MIEQAEYGYMEGKYLRSRLIKPITRTWVDGDGVQHTETVSVEQQIAALSEEWKPVDAISPEALVSEDENYIIVPVPYDQGERIAYRYEKRYDYQRIKQQVADLKQALTDSDYKVMKCYEASMLGQPLPYDIDAVHSERQTMRNKINELEPLLPQNTEKVITL